MNLLKCKTNRNSFQADVAPEDLFPSIAGEYGALWLDSSLHFGNRGNCSFIARHPEHDISWNLNNITAKSGNDLLRFKKKDADFFDFLQKFLANEQQFVIGYIGYEATLPFLDLKYQIEKNLFPLARFLVYKSILVYDHLTKTYTVTNPQYDDYVDLFKCNGVTKKDKLYRVNSAATVEATRTKDEYINKIKNIKYHIKEGDIYQANFTTRFDVKCSTDPFDIYLYLRQLNPSPYGGFLNFGDFRILCSSPERMFKKNGLRITTSPIKGTIALGNNSREKARNLNRLLHSEKDKAELLMIVDLERNDLGKLAQTGTVKVERLLQPEIYSSLIHLVSDISAELKPDIEMKDILQALLPGGSITGAPKKRAVEIINRMENQPRTIYTGCIGYINGNNTDFNIAIRTIIHQDNTYFIHAGSGIVADSDPESEYAEMLLKAKNMFKSLGVEQWSAKK